jgi:primosomal protein N'
MVVERDEHPVVNSLIRWNPIPYLNRLISDLAEADLPPSTRHILLKSEDAERIYTGFLAALRENRIPANSKIHNLGNGVISIFFTLKSAKTMLSFLYEFQKRRSMSGKPLAKVRIDPYLLG